MRNSWTCFSARFAVLGYMKLTSRLTSSLAPKDFKCACKRGPACVLKEMLFLEFLLSGFSDSYGKSANSFLFVIHITAQ